MNVGLLSAPKLVELNISFNLLQSLDDVATLSKLCRLSSLDCRSNPISDLVFQGLVWLTSKSEYAEFISTIPRKIATLTSVDGNPVFQLVSRSDHRFATPLRLDLSLSATLGSLQKILRHVVASKATQFCKTLYMLTLQCATPYSCLNWKERFEIALRVRQKKHWDCGRNFCDL